MEHPVFKDPEDAAAFERILRVIRASREERATGVTPASLLRLAARLLTERQRRAEQFGDFAHLFGEPGWDILLYLFSQNYQRRQISVTELTHSVQTAGTTVLRYLDALRRCGIIAKSPDWEDRRRTFVSLTERGTQLMESYLVSIDR